MLKYLVDIELAVSGDPSGKIGGIGGKLQTVESSAKSLRGELASLGSSLVDGFTGAVEAVGSKLLTLGKLGAAGGIAAVAYGVGGLNNQLEQTQIALGAVLNANSMSKGLEEGMARASGWIAQMRKDAKDLPGEFEDLLGFVQNAASPAFQSGLGIDQFEKLSAQAMASAKALQVPMAQAAREYAQLLEGRAGAHNIFGTRLGIHAQGFNEKSGEERVKILQDALGKFDPAIKAFGRSFDAQSSTLIDNAKMFVQAATGPLFGKITTALGEANAWFDKNQDKVKLWSDNIGYQLGKAFDYGKEVFLEYGPLLLDFGGKAYDKIVRLWQDAQPFVHEIGEDIKGFLKDDGSLDKIATVLKLYIAAKAGGPLLGAVGAIGRIGTGIGGLLGGGGAASAGAGAVGVGAAGAGAAEAGGAAALGIGGVGAVGALFGSFLVALPAAIAGAITATGYEVYDAQNKSRTVDAMGGGAYGYNEKELSARDKMIDGAIQAGIKLNALQPPIVDFNNEIDISTKTIGVGFSDVGDAANSLAFTLRSLAKSGDFAAIAKINEAVDKAEEEGRKAAAESAKDYSNSSVTAAAVAILASQNIDKAKAAAADLEKERKKVAGKGGTTIQKVEITVSSNQSPEQIARATLAELQHVRRYRTSSPRTTNFSAGR